MPFHALQQTRKALLLETPINVPVIQSVRCIISHPFYSLQLPQHLQKVDAATREARTKTDKLDNPQLPEQLSTNTKNADPLDRQATEERKQPP